MELPIMFEFMGRIIDVELVKDFLKLFLIAVPLLLLVVNGWSLISKDRRFILIIAGFVLFFFGFFLDFTGDLPEFNDFAVLGKNAPHHERMEDVLGLAGFLLFVWGIMTEVRYMKRITQEKTEMVEKLERQSRKLKRMDEMKTSFVHNVSHEFRSPLNIIHGHLENLLDGVAGPLNDQQKTFLKSTYDTTERLSRLVDDLLDISRIEAGKFDLHREKIDVRELVEKIVEMFHDIAQRKNVNLHYSVSNDVSYVWGDRDKLEQCLVNLLNNAIKYTLPNTQVDVLVSMLDKRLRIEVRDRGRGIAEQDIPKLFDKFERILEERAAGTGLGLAITKDLIELHKGRIWVESRLDEGSHFIFEIPKDLRA